jgi:hypothetical protein
VAHDRRIYMMIYKTYIKIDIEESDEGDYDDKEVDYISDSGR